MIWWKIEEVAPPPLQDVLLFFPETKGRRVVLPKMLRIGRVEQFEYRSPSKWAMVEEPEE